MEEPDYYTAQEAADKLGIKYHTLLSRARRKIYTARKVAHSVIFDKQEIDNHVDARPLEKPTR